MQTKILGKSELKGVLKTKTGYLPLVLLMVALATALYCLYFYLSRNVAWDILLHSRILVNFLENGSFPVPGGYPLMIWLFSGFSYEVPVLVNASVWVILLMTLGKLAVIFFILNKYWKQWFGEPGINGLWIIAGISLVMMMVAPVYTFQGYFYFGRIALTIWHNPTTIAVTPFVLLLFFLTPAFLKDPRGNALGILILGGLNILIKPSFMFAWIPGVFLYAVLMNYNFKKLIKIFTILLLLGGFILLQYFLIYVTGTLDEIIYQTKPGRIILQPMLIWNHYLNHGNTSFFVSFITSFFFPLIFFALYLRNKQILPMVWLALCIMGFGLFFSWMLAEEGYRLYDGNFLWTSYLTNLTLFLAVLVNVIYIRSQKSSSTWKEWVIYAALALHLLSGIGFMVNTIIEKNYL